MSKWSNAIYHRQNGQYYKYIIKQQGPEILAGDTEEALERECPEFHDHFFKRDGIWYVQSKSNKKKVFQEKLRPGVEGFKQHEAGEYLDELLRELKRRG